MLISMLALRDRRARVVGYAVSGCPEDTRHGGGHDEEARTIMEQVPLLSRLAGRSIIVPVTPALVRDGAITRFASIDAVWLLATEAIDDHVTRRAVDRLIGMGFQFALLGFPEGEPLLPSLTASIVILDAARTPPAILSTRIRTLTEAGLRPLVKGVDDRLLRREVLAAGASLYCGRQLVRGAAVPSDRSAEDSIIRAITALAAFCDGRPPDAAFDAFVQDDPHIASALLKAVSSAALGVRGPRSVSHALTMLGRDSVMERMTGVIARLIGEAAQDGELAFLALRRARLCERVGSALDSTPHPRARAIAGLLSTLEFAIGSPGPAIAQRMALPQLLMDVLGDRTQALGQLIDVVDAIDYAWWDDMLSRSRRLGIRPRVIGEAWLEAWRVARDELGVARAEGF